MSVTIEILSNTRCRVHLLKKKHFRALDNLLAMDIDGAVFSSAHRRSGGAWDGRKHLFYWKNSQAESASFPRGLLSRVEEYLEDAGVKYKCRDRRKRILPEADLTCVHADMLEGISMSGDYAYQLDVTRVSLAMQQGILWLATNAGKTEIAAAIIKALPDLNILFVVPKKTLLRQTVARLAERLGTVEQEIGVIGGGRFDPRSVTVAIINSIKPMRVTKKTSANAKRKRLAMKRYLKTVQCIFLDEGHHARATTWYKLIQSLTAAQFRYLLSGTPFGSGNALMVEAATGPVIARVSNDELIELGVSARPLVRMIEIDQW